MLIANKLFWNIQRVHLWFIYWTGKKKYGQIENFRAQDLWVGGLRIEDFKRLDILRLY